MAWFWGYLLMGLMLAIYEVVPVMNEIKSEPVSQDAKVMAFGFCCFVFVGIVAIWPIWVWVTVAEKKERR